VPWQCPGSAPPLYAAISSCKWRRSKAVRRGVGRAPRVWLSLYLVRAY
jgi:hypothetical protein